MRTTITRTQMGVVLFLLAASTAGAAGPVLERKILGACVSADGVGFGGIEIVLTPQRSRLWVLAQGKMFCVYESYTLEAVAGGRELIHLLGLRDDPRIRSTWNRMKPVTLYYAGYNPRRRKTVQAHSIMTRRSNFGNQQFGPMAMAALNDDVFPSMQTK